MKTATNGKKKTTAKKSRMTDAADSMKRLVIAAPNIQTVLLHLRGTTPYVQNKFSKRTRQQIAKTQAEGTKAAKGKRVKPPKDFQRLYEECQHTDASKGWNGIPCSAFRNSMIRACSLIDFKMTIARMALWVEAEGYGDDGVGLVRIRKTKPEYFETPVRLQSGVMDIRVRAMWPIGWEATVGVRYNADIFAAEDVANLMMHAGIGVGVGEGRDGSKSSNGMGWGNFELLDREAGS